MSGRGTSFSSVETLATVVIIVVIRIDGYSLQSSDLSASLVIWMGLVQCLDRIALFKGHKSKQVAYKILDMLLFARRAFLETMNYSIGPLYGRGPNNRDIAH